MGFAHSLLLAESKAHDFYKARAPVSERGLFLMVLTVLLCITVIGRAACNAHAATTDDFGDGNDVVPRDLHALLRAYPEAEMKAEQDASGWHVLLGEERLLFQPVSGCPVPNPEAREDQALCAMFGFPYPTGSAGRFPAPGFEPGRVRSETLLKMLYGKTAAEVRQNLAPVRFFGATVSFNKKHGAAAALERVGRRLELLAHSMPGLRGYIMPMAGTFHWRVIAGTHRLSAHSFGISIDLNVKRAPYWRWNKQTDPAVKEARANYPQALVDAFEAEGFIWGGKWHAFDFMHFEYRPELLPKIREP
jgi:hypothetical protein